MKEMTISNQERIKQIYRDLKSDLTLCVKYHRKGKSDLVKEYFWTDQWEEIEKQLAVICKPLSVIQKIQISKVITELHNFYITNSTEEWEKKSKRRSKNSAESLK